MRARSFISEQNKPPCSDISAIEIQFKKGYIMKRKFSITLLVVSILLVGCSDHKSEAKKVTGDSGQKVKEVLKSKKEDNLLSRDNKQSNKKNESPTNNQLSKFYQIFSDGAKISPNGKPMLLVFGQSADPYTQKMQKDVNGNRELASAISSSVTPIYIDAMGQKLHKLDHNGKLMDVDTKTLVGIYHIDATPTLIFADKEGKTIFIVPGYMPPKQFEVTLKFVAEGEWRGKDRDNGDIYRTLKSYYESHGINVSKAKK